MKKDILFIFLALVLLFHTLMNTEVRKWKITMKNYIIIILLFVSCLTAQQKSDQQYASYAYTLSKGLDLPLGTLIAALNISALILKNNIKPLTIE